MRPTWQYSLRGLMLATVVVALYVTAYAAMIRDFARSGQAHRLLPALLPIVAAVGAFVFQHWRNRKRLDESAIYLERKKRAVAAMVFLCAWPVAVGASYLVLQRWLEVGTGPIWLAILSGLLVAMTMGAIIGLVMILWPSVALCNSGIIYHGIYFAPWKRVREATWKEADPTVLSIQFYGQHVELNVLPEKRAAVDSLLNEKLPIAKSSLV